MCPPCTCWLLGMGSTRGNVRCCENLLLFWNRTGNSSLSRVLEGGGTPLNSVTHLWEPSGRRWVHEVHIDYCKLEKPPSTKRKGEGKIVILSYVRQYGQIRRLAIQDPNVYQPRGVFLWALSVVFYPIPLPCQPLPSKWLVYMKDTGIRIYRDRNKHRVTRKKVSKIIMFHKTPEDNKLLVCEREGQTDPQTSGPIAAANT